MIVLDTDHLSILLDERDARRGDLVARLDRAIDPIAIPVIVVEECLRGWLAQIRRARKATDQVVPYHRLAKLIRFFSAWHIVDWDVESALWFEKLQKSKLRIGSPDLKIASIALANDALLLTANLRHFKQVAELHVENWLRNT
jgi:tRNA(fMet)-specific endonuclease VapC